MPAVQVWDSYAQRLATLGQWEAYGTIATDAVAMVRENPNGAAVGLQAVQLLKKTWSTLPGDIRTLALGVLDQIGGDILDQWDSISGAAGNNPIAGWVLAAIDGVMTIAKGVSGSNDVKRAASDYEHGNGQDATIRSVIYKPNGSLYSVATCFEYAQFVKIRGGGDYDKKPCFTRAGLARDSIFTGVASPGDGGSCKVEMRRKIDESFGPFKPGKCNRKIGISPLLWPWWSCAYGPAPLMRWQGSPAGASFQAGMSRDSNATLTQQQALLLTDAATNLQASFSGLETKVATFLSWWDAKGGTNQTGTTVVELQHGSVRSGGAVKRIEARFNPRHEPHSGAEFYWYYDTTGTIRGYDGHANSLKGWGLELPHGPSGAPPRLGVSLGQHNAVLAARAAFSERRLATLRSPALVRGLVTEFGMGAVDPSARQAVEYARASQDLVLPYPGASPTKQVIPGRMPPLKTLPKKKRKQFMVVPVLGAAALVVGGDHERSKKKSAAAPMLMGAAALGILMMRGRK